MSGLSLLALVTLMIPGQPSISEIAPDPLPLGATAQIDGAGFVTDETAVDIGGVAQDVVYAQEASLIFLVSAGTPLGSQTLRVTTPTGEASQSVEVVPTAPDIQGVSPEPLVLGGVGTATGTDLMDVTEVSLGGVDCPLITVAVAVVVFEIPVDGELLGDQVLMVTAPWGFDVEDVTVAAPVAEVDQIGPNPARQGDVLTVAGLIVALPGTSLMIGDVMASLVDVTDGQIRAQVPEDLSPGPWDIMVLIGGQGSVPVGPLWVEAADPERPRVDGVYPGQVASTGRFWVVGEHLDQVDASTHALNLEGCLPWACLIAAEGLGDGPHVVALMGTTGADLFSVDVLGDGDLVQPVITGVEPSPAFRGQPLTILGEDLYQVGDVLLGGVPQVIEYVSADAVRVTVDPTTPMGAEPLIVAGNSASEALVVTVLSPFPTAAPDAVGASDGTASSDGGDSATVASPRDDGGCAAAIGSPCGWLALLGLGLWWRRPSRGHPWG